MHLSQLCLCWVAPEDRVLTKQSCQCFTEIQNLDIWNITSEVHAAARNHRMVWDGRTLKFQSPEMDKDTFHYPRLLQVPSSTCQVKQIWTFHSGWMKHQREPKGSSSNSQPHNQYLSLNKAVPVATALSWPHPAPLVKQGWYRHTGRST